MGQDLNTKPNKSKIKGMSPRPEFEALMGLRPKEN